MRDSSARFRIAAALGVLDAGACGVAAAWVAALAGWAIAQGWTQWPLARVLLTAVSTLAGVAALWLAVRIAIDRRLFVALAQAVPAPEPGSDDGLEALDRALVDLGWIDREKVGRTLDARVRGVVRLCRQGIWIAAAQWLAVGCAIGLSGFAPGWIR